MIIATWSIRRLNQPLKQKKIKLFLIKHKINIFGCLENRVKKNKASNIMKNIVEGWNTCCNYPKVPNGRIWLL